MTGLKVYNEGIMVSCADPIFLTSGLDYRLGAEITFEVLDVDALGLKRRLGKVEQYGIDSSRPPFSAVLTTLEPCQSTHSALSLERGRATMRGVLKVRGFTTIDVKAEPA